MKHFALLAACLSVVRVLAFDNELTEAEKRDGWILLFNGRTTDGWMNSDRTAPRTPVEEGALNPHKAGHYMLVHTQEWSNFVLSLDFKISRGCNSGIFIRTASLTAPPGKDVGYNGIEIAIDDTPGAGYHDTGAIYELVKPSRQAMKPVGEWNHIEITSLDNRIDVVLNGDAVTHADLSRFTEPNKRPDGSAHKFDIAYQQHPLKGYIGLQDHGSPCWFKNIKLRPISGMEEPVNHKIDWFQQAHYGVFMHFLPADDAGLARVAQFDTAALARQLESMGAKYFFVTLGQNSGYFLSPNAAYNRVTGYSPGERCSVRDLPLDLFDALETKGIKLMLYLPCQVPNGDVRAQRAFGLREGAQDQPLSIAFAEKWAEVIQEWSDRYGEKVKGWWFDGGYEHIGFNESIAKIYAAAVRHGNPRAIVTFNPGVRLIRYTEAEDYTAGELNEPFKNVPAGRWVKGSQWHALTFLGTQWGRRDTRYPTENWADWLREVVAHGGVVSLDMGPNWDPAVGAIGALAPAQVAQVKAMKESLARRDAAAPGPPAARSR